MPTGHTHIKLKGVLLDSPLGTVVTLGGAYLNAVDTLTKSLAEGAVVKTMMSVTSSLRWVKSFEQR